MNHQHVSNDHSYHSTVTNLSCSEYVLNEQNQTNERNEACLSGVMVKLNPDSEESWQVTDSKIRKRNSLPSQGSIQKKLRPGVGAITDQIRPAIPLSNSYQALEGLNENNMDEDEPTPAQAREFRPPPVFIPNVNNIKSMVQTIETMIDKAEYKYKCINQDCIKISPSSPDSYRKLVSGLTKLNLRFHTYQLKQERAYRVVLRNMHFSTPLEDLKNAVEENGHKVRNIVNARNNYTKKPLSLFFIDLEPNNNNKDVFKIQYLLNAKIVFEPPKRNKEIVQCKRCQRYGHTKSYCRNDFRCVKCGQDHDTKMCKKPPDAPPTCALCFGEHPANYKGCSLYKELKNKQFPPLRTKHIDARPNQPQTPKEGGVRPTQRQIVTENISFAQVTKGVVPSQPSKSSEELNSNSNDILVLSTVIQKSFERIEKVLTTQSEQISTLLNLLSKVITRLN